MERFKGKFPQKTSSDTSNRFNPKLPPAGRNPSARKKAKAPIDPDAFSDDKSAKYNPKR